MRKEYSFISIVLLVLFTLVGSARPFAVPGQFSETRKGSLAASCHSLTGGKVSRGDHTTRFKIAAKAKIRVRYRARYFTTNFGQRLFKEIRQFFVQDDISVHYVHHVSSHFYSLRQQRGPPVC